MAEIRLALKEALGDGGFEETSYQGRHGRQVTIVAKGQLVEIESGDRYQDTGPPVKFALQGLQERLVAGAEIGQHRARGVRCGNEIAPQVFGEGPDQRSDQFLAQGRDLPAELITAQAGQHSDGDMHGVPGENR